MTWAGTNGTAMSSAARYLSYCSSLSCFVFVLVERANKRFITRGPTTWRDT